MPDPGFFVSLQQAAEYSHYFFRLKKLNSPKTYVQQNISQARQRTTTQQKTPLGLQRSDPKKRRRHQRR
jgi:hypothetical protein